MNHIFKFTIAILLIFSTEMFDLAFAQGMYMCVWRNPERTMTRLFPRAKDYKTINKKISRENLKLIESRVGELLPGQKDVFQYFEMLGSNGKLLGYTIASTQKGEYGAIEFVFGLSVNKKIIGIYIQRARERDREFRKKVFLRQFVGKDVRDVDLLRIGSNIRAKKTAGTVAVSTGIMKELVTMEVLTK